MQVRKTQVTLYTPETPTAITVQEDAIQVTCICGHKTTNTRISCGPGSNRKLWIFNKGAAVTDLWSAGSMYLSWRIETESILSTFTLYYIIILVTTGTPTPHSLRGLTLQEAQRKSKMERGSTKPLSALWPMIRILYCTRWRKLLQHHGEHITAELSKEKQKLSKVVITAWLTKRGSYYMTTSFYYSTLLEDMPYLSTW